MAHSKEKIMRETIIFGFWKEEAQTLKLVNKDFKSVILNILKELMESMDKELKEFRKMM